MLMQDHLIDELFRDSMYEGLYLYVCNTSFVL